MHAPKFNRFRLIHPCDGQTDRHRQTDGRTDGRAIAYSALSMLSRANKDRKLKGVTTESDYPAPQWADRPPTWCENVRQAARVIGVCIFQLTVVMGNVRVVRVVRGVAI